MLTIKQENFCQGIASNLSLSDAYRQAYDTKTAKPTSIHPTASKLAHRPEIALRIEALREEAAADCSWTRDRYVLALWDRSQQAAKRGQYSASIKALELIARACGIGGTDRVEHTGMVGVEVLARLSMDQLESLARPVPILPPSGAVVVESEALN